jgi:hypothetical protein
MICSANGGLQISKNRIHPGEAFHIGAFAALANNLALLRTAEQPASVTALKHHRPSETVLPQNLWVDSRTWRPEQLPGQ